MTAVEYRFPLDYAVGYVNAYGYPVTKVFEHVIAEVDANGVLILRDGMGALVAAFSNWSDIKEHTSLDEDI